jgi:mRNA interferase MazF
VVTNPHRGEVWWGEIEGLGRRPYLVLTRDAAIPVLNQVVCAPLTRTVRGIPTALFLSAEDGMPADCAASFDNLITIPKATLTSMVIALTIERRIEMCRALRIALDC